MTVTNKTNTVQEAGNGVKLAFTFDFKIFNASDLVVKEIDQTTLVATDKVITTDYTVTINTTTEGGTVTYLTEPASGKDSFIKRLVDIDQQTDVPTEGNIPEASLNNEYDKQVMIDIQQQEEIDRAIKFAETSALSDVTFPESTSASARANKVIAYDTAGTGLELLTVADSGLVVDPIAVQGDLIQGSSAGAAEKLAIGTVEDVLQVVAGKAAWVTGTGSGIVVLTTSPTIITPTIASFVNMAHDHADAAGGSTIAGRSVQVVNTQDGAVATGTTILPADNTIPQKTEGDEYMTLAITPKNTNNKLKIEVTVNAAASINQTLSAVLFQDSTANALAVSSSFINANESRNITFIHFMTAGTTSATTFKVRAGVGGAGTTTFNGSSGSGEYGGVLASSITITEIQV